MQSVFSVVLDFGIKDNIDKVDLEKPDIKAKNRIRKLFWDLQIYTISYTKSNILSM